jgi:hypothetical protein
MIYGFNEKKEKVEIQDTVIMSTIQTTISSIHASVSWANYIDAENYQIDGYKFLGIIGSDGGHGVIISDWAIVFQDQLMVNFYNPTGADRTNVNFKIYGLYVKV